MRTKPFQSLLLCKSLLSTPQTSNRVLQEALANTDPNLLDALNRRSKDLDCVTADSEGTLRSAQLFY